MLLSALPRRALYLEIDNPSVALLNVGEEPTKGSKQVKEAYAVLQQQPHLNFIGNVEAHEAVQGKANVVLADGFVGNALLKYSEGLGQAIAKDLGERLAPELGPEKARAIAMDISRKINLMETAGGPILGVNGIVIVGHGRARAPMVHGAIRYRATAERPWCRGGHQDRIERDPYAE